MTMKELEIAVAVPPAQSKRQYMVDLQSISISKVQPTGGTHPLLSLEQVRHLRQSVRVGTLPFRPIEPIAVEWAFRAPHLDMPSDWHNTVVHQALFVGGKVPSSSQGMPVGGGAQLPRFVGMTPFGPLPQAPKQ